MTNINIIELKDLCLKALTNAGLSESDAAITTDHYLENELSGKTSHGLVRVVQAVGFIKQNGAPQTPPQIATDKGNIVIIDGKMNIAPVLGKAVLDQSILRAQKHGLAMVGGNNYFGNTGSMAYYLKRLADKDLIAFISCNSVACVAAPNGREKLFGTNPIGLAIPSEDGNHFISDFATSAIAYGKVLAAVDKGEAIPDNCIIDKDGYPSTNPKDAFPNGAILPLADYRGHSLALFLEMLCLLLGADVIKDDMHGKDALFMIVIDPSHISGNGYSSRVTQILNQIRGNAPAPNKSDITIPGDRSSKILAQSMDCGMIEVTNKTLENLKELAK